MNIRYITPYYEKLDWIKLHIRSFNLCDIIVLDGLKGIFEYNFMLYSKEHEQKYIDNSMLYIRAALEIGIRKADVLAAFQPYAIQLNMNLEEIFDREDYCTTRIYLNHEGLSRALGRWLVNQKNIVSLEDAINDILYKIENNMVGTYYYHKYYSSLRYAYKLVIPKNKDHNPYICNMNSTLYYTLYKEDENPDIDDD